MRLPMWAFFGRRSARRMSTPVMPAVCWACRGGWFFQDSDVTGGWGR